MMETVGDGRRGACHVHASPLFLRRPIPLFPSGSALLLRGHAPAPPRYQLSADPHQPSLQRPRAPLPA